MEPEVGAALVNNSSILKDNNVRVRVVMGDEDLIKLADTNHMKENFTKELYKMEPKFKEMRKPEVILNIQKCYNHAVSQNAGNSGKLDYDLSENTFTVIMKNVVSGAFIRRKQRVVLQDSQLRAQL